MNSGLVYSVKVADLPRRRAYPFCLSAHAEDCQKVCADLNLLALHKVSLKGQITATGTTDWVLTADFSASVTQACVITLKPVITRIRERIQRVYSARSHCCVSGTNTATNVEIPATDCTDPLTDTIDIGGVLYESLALALPLYPRVSGIDFGSQGFAAPGKRPADEETRPFAGLKKLCKNE